MLKSEEVIFIRRLFLILGFDDKIKLLYSSNLTRRERDIMLSRFVSGCSLKQIASEHNLSVDGLDKAIKKTYLKLFLWITCSGDYEFYKGLVSAVEDKDYLSSVSTYRRRV